MTKLRVLLAAEGQLAYFLGRSLVARGARVTVIHPDREECVALARRLEASVIHGDPTDPRVLDEAGAGGADLVLALTAADERNLAICQHARRRFGVARALAGVSDPENEDVFRRLGIDAFSPIRFVTCLVEQRADFGSIASLMPVASGAVNVADVRLAPDAPACGAKIRDLDLPPGALVGCILRGDRPVVPGGDTELTAGDHLLVIATPDRQRAALLRLTGEPA